MVIPIVGEGTPLSGVRSYPIIHRRGGLLLLVASWRPTADEPQPPNVPSPSGTAESKTAENE